MATKDISDLQVCQAVRDSRANNYKPWPAKLLHERTGQPEKVCYRAMERASKRGLIEYGTSLMFGWLTPKGEELLRQGVSRAFIDQWMNYFLLSRKDVLPELKETDHGT